MNETLSDIYLKSIIKSILFFVIFWVGNYFVLTSVYKEKSEWTYEHVLASIGVTTVLAVCLILFLFFFNLGGLLIGAAGTFACILGLAWIGDKIAKILSYSIVESCICYIGVFINLIVLVRLTLNIRNFIIARYAEKT